METDRNGVHEGGCVCGAVRYRVRGLPLRVTVCHSDWCRQRTGSAFGTEAVFKEDQVEMMGQAPSSYRHTSDRSGRWLEQAFCGHCGANIGLRLEVAPGIRTIGAGTFDNQDWIGSGKVPVSHVFARSARDWAAIPDGVDVYDAYLPGR